MMQITIFTQAWVGRPPSPEGQQSERQAFVKLIVFGMPIHLTVAMAEELQMALGKSIGDAVALFEQPEEADALLNLPPEGRA